MSEMAIAPLFEMPEIVLAARAVDEWADQPPHVIEPVKRQLLAVRQALAVGHPDAASHLRRLLDMLDYLETMLGRQQALSPIWEFAQAALRKRSIT